MEALEKLQLLDKIKRHEWTPEVFTQVIQAGEGIKPEDLAAIMDKEESINFSYECLSYQCRDDPDAIREAQHIRDVQLSDLKGNEKPAEKTPLVCIDDVEEEEISWLVPPYIPRGKLTLCGAYPGVGKTFLMCYLAACVSSGRQFFDMIPFKGKPEKVIYLTTEDGIGDTIKARLRACGATMGNIYSIPDGKNNLLFTSPEIEDYMKAYKPALMVFDPFQSYIGSNVDMNAANKTRDCLNVLVGLAKQYNVAIVLICHFNKNSKGDTITRIIGSTDIMGACRSFLALGIVPGEEDLKYMSHEKSSLEKKGSTLLFKIDPDHGGILFQGKSELSADDYARIKSQGGRNEGKAAEAAREFIIDNMPDGRRPAQEIYNLAEASGFSERTIRRAVKELGITREKTKGFQPQTIWIMPRNEETEQEQHSLPS